MIQPHVPLHAREDDAPEAVVVHTADAAHIEGAKRLADANREVFSFLTRAAFEEAWRERALLVALMEGRVVGFVRYHHRRRDTHTTLYDICVDEPLRGRGVGSRMFHCLKDECRTLGRTVIGLKCPAGARANAFYVRQRFSLVATLPGKGRPLRASLENSFSPGQAAGAGVRMTE